MTKPPEECRNFGVRMCHWDSGTLSLYQTYTHGWSFSFDTYNTGVHILYSFSERLLKTSQQSSCTSSSACTLPFLLIKYVVVIPREFLEISSRRAIPWPAVFYSKGKRQSPWWHHAREHAIQLAIRKPSMHAYFYGRANGACLCSWCCSRHLWFFHWGILKESRSTNPWDRRWGETRWRGGGGGGGWGEGKGRKKK